MPPPYSSSSNRPNIALFSAVHDRTQKLLKTTLENVIKLTDPSNVSIVNIWKADLDDKWNQFARAFEAYEELLIASDDEDHPVLPTVTDQYIAIHTKCMNAKLHIQNLIDAFHSTSGVHESTTYASPETSSRIRCKLPPVRITPFAGDSGDWIEFKATCMKVLTDDMPDIQKLQYLKDALVGEPRNIVAFVMPEEGAYAKAFDLLKTRYENFRKIINDKLRQFFAIPNMDTPSASAFRSMLNTTNTVISTLNSCRIDTDHWAAILIFVLTQKFDASTLELWEEKLNGKRTVPPLQVLLEFLETRIIVRADMDDHLPASSDKQIKSFVKPSPRPNPIVNTNKEKHAKAFFTLKAEYKCMLCGSNHLPSRCDQIVRLSTKERYNLVREGNLCFNCFYPHQVKDCPFNPSCKRCLEPHHTLLHVDKQKVFLNLAEQVNPSNNDNDSASNGIQDDALSHISAHHFYHIKDDDDALLATAMVPLHANGRSAVVKTLIDQGSTANLITTRACRLLNIQFVRNKTPMLGVGNTPVGHVFGRTKFEIGSIQTHKFRLFIKAIVVQSIGEVKGVERGVINSWEHLNGLPLADPKYFEANHVDMLLGSATHADIILGGLIKGKQNEPIAQQSELGWIVSGHINATKTYVDFCRLTTIEQSLNEKIDLNAQLKAFWELEEVAFTRFLTDEEQRAEDTFKNSLKRANDGKFVLDLPFKRDPFNKNCFGESRALAEKRYKSIQRRFARNPELGKKYDAVFEEYLSLGHMKLVENKPEFRFFLPHHPVIKETSSTTKVRNVFDGSAKSSNGVSLNDNLCVGPTIQSELFELIIQWRKYEFAISGDIEKMYRMFWVNPAHANFQTILWQRPGTDSIKEYILLTVTFGTSSAAFQAIRGVFEIGEQAKADNIHLAEAIQKCFYVDDFMKSFATIESAIEMRESITKKLAEYGLYLRKWKSNDERTLEGLDHVDKETLSLDSTLKTLGISWQPSTDVFTFKSSETKETTNWTKRKILSEISKLFDPLGWLSPYIIQAKILMQDIWRLPKNTGWDSELPEHIKSQWQYIVGDLIAPIPIRVPRWIKLSNRKMNIEIHGFCDAANLAYAAAVYLRLIHANGEIACNLIAAKTRVAPVRVVTLARLELCGAVLLTKLMRRCCQALSLDEFQAYTWSDSKIVLAWISTHPSKWVTFVANRVSEIQQMTESSGWSHVPSKQNPADIATRGTPMETLKESSLWWKGPEFLLSSSKTHPNRHCKLPIETAPDRKKAIKIHHVHEPRVNIVLDYFSDFNRLLRFTVYAMRWRHKTHDKSIKFNAPIVACEINAAEVQWLKLIQRECFGHEIGRLKIQKNLPQRSSIRNLNPFLDSDGFLRMNGRVGNANLREQKTAIILPAENKFVSLIIHHTHQRTLHGGLQLTLRTLRERFWIIHARNQVKKLINKCVICFRYKKKLLTQQMAELPSFRTEQCKPFTYVGCDYAGYFEIKSSERRNAPIIKGYIALFICLTTKAIHLELACDLSSAEFIMAFENFIARRGIPAVLYTDNATNFVGAEREIRELLKQWLEQNGAVTNMLANYRIQFKRIPARASHMAGIWERSVGLVKYHLRRVLKDTKLTTRRFDHLLKQIECCLNSRPLWSLTPNADDIEVITPSHFFNFQPINSLPRPDLSHIPINRLDQYQYLYRLYTDFWKGWSAEYLHQLQPRQKWQKTEPNVRVGQVVIISDDNLPPSRWSMGKITAVFPAKDGLVRTVDVKSKGAVLRRPIHRLGLLPILDNEDLSCEHLNAGENVGEVSHGKETLEKNSLT